MMPLAINQATTRPQWTLKEAIAGYAKAGVRGIGVWPDKLRECGLAEAKRRLAESGLVVSSYAGGELFVKRDGAVQPDDVAHRLVDEAAEIKADCLVCVVGGLPAGSRDIAGARMRARDRLAALLPRARAAGVPLAIEPVHPMRAADVSCINTLDAALDLCDALGTGVGVAVDAYHVWWDPALSAAIARAKGRIVSFQLCDWLAEMRALMDDRGMPGDGIIDLSALTKQVQAAGFTGLPEIEIMSARDWWKRDPNEAVRICVQRFAAIRSS
jgi:sugar phosphate isomerase/epimerase